MPNKSSNVTHLRRDIDSGRTGDKAPGFDPAAAPLGTDEEAAGTPPSAAEIEQARRLERRSDILDVPNAVAPERTPNGAPRRPVSPVLIMIAISVIIAVMAALFFGMQA
jgi:hypothetical protein